MSPANFPEVASGDAAIRAERVAFAAQVRSARSALGWSQQELASAAGVAQRSIFRLEQGDADVRRATAVAVEQALKSQGVTFEALPDGGFKLTVSGRSLSEKGLTT
jgi:transcriptional regulator with XRE-family HTH domain